jgi:hypothetical protein
MQQTASGSPNTFLPSAIACSLPSVSDPRSQRR